MNSRKGTGMRWSPLVRLAALALLLGGCDGKINNGTARKTLTTVVNLNSQNQLSDDNSNYPVISEDGSFVAFHSFSTNLAPELTTTTDENVYIRDTLHQTMTCASLNMFGNMAQGKSKYPSLSGNGRYVVFESTATDLVPGYSNDQGDVFIRDLVTGTTTLVSQTHDELEANGYSIYGCASWDGRYVAFTSVATNLAPSTTADTSNLDVFVRDIENGDTIPISWNTFGEPSPTCGGGIRDNVSPFSKDNRYVIFESDGTDLVSPATNGFKHVFLRDIQSGTTELISRRDGPTGNQADVDSYMGGISHDGRYVAFSSSGISTTPSDTNIHVYVRDRIEHTTTRVSVDSTGGEGSGYQGVLAGDSIFFSISGDGNIVVFTANDLSGLDQTSDNDIYAHNRTTGVTLLMSVSSGSYLQAEVACEYPLISGDGSTITYISKSSGFSDIIPPNNSQSNIFRRGSN
jgi:hypothetical protein